jgi:hypothetical protein
MLVYVYVRSCHVVVLSALLGGNDHGSFSNNTKVSTGFSLKSLLYDAAL